MRKEIVIASYDKPLDWLNTINGEVKKTIYRKGDILELKENEIEVTPNVGRCVHTFFNHIVNNYNNLSDYTFFVQDYPFDHWGNLVDIINNDVSEIPKNASLIIGGYYGFHNNTLGTAWSLFKSNHFSGGHVLVCQGNGHPQDLNPNINVDRVWDQLFDHKKPNNYEFMPGGHFVITKEQIKNRSLQFYQKIVDLLESDETMPWNIERLECYIFCPNYKTKL